MRGGNDEKSSKRWARNWIPWLLDRIQQRASDRVLKSLGCFATKGEPHSKVICTTPADSEETPEVRVDREDFESTGDVCFWEPWPFPGEFDKGDGMVDGGVVEKSSLRIKLLLGDHTAVGCWKIDDDALLFVVFSGCITKGADAEVRKRRAGEWLDHETLLNFLSERAIDWLRLGYGWLKIFWFRKRWMVEWGPGWKPSPSPLYETSFSEVGCAGVPPPQKEQMWSKRHWYMVHPVLLKLQIERRPWCMTGLLWGRMRL